MKENEQKTLLRSSDDLIAAVEQYGFLPFFRNEIHGFSIEELCPPELWFADDVDGPWEWKGPAARSGKCLYGKIFKGKAKFLVSTLDGSSAAVLGASAVGWDL